MRNTVSTTQSFKNLCGKWGLGLVAALISIGASGCNRAPEIKPEQMSQAVVRQNAAHIQSIENDPSLTPEQKQKAIESLRARGGGMPTAPR